MNRSAKLAVAVTGFMLLVAAVPELRGEPSAPVAGQVLTAQGNVHLRSAAPQGVLKNPGKVIAKLKKGDDVRVLEQQTVRTLFASYQWARVEKVCTNAGCRNYAGWVYLGQTKDGQPYFRPRPQ